MKQFVKPMVFAMCLGAQAAGAAVQHLPLTPGATHMVATDDDTIYSIARGVNGSFTDSYYFDFSTNNTEPDIWTFSLLGIGVAVNGTQATGFSGMSMRLYNANGTLSDDSDDSLLAGWPIDAIGTSEDTVQTVDANGQLFQVTITTTQWQASGYQVLDPGMYRFDVSGSGNGTYNAVLTVPEPETWAMFLLGATLVGLRMRRRVAKLG